VTGLDRATAHSVDLMSMTKGARVETNESDREGRGPNAPSETLASAIQLLHLVRDRLGFSSASRESVAEALGYRTLNGTSRRKIAALSHYELLVRTGAAYRISDLGKQILIPRDDNEHRQAIATAARKPSFYGKLFAKYEGQALPGMLSNILVREFGILPQSSDEVARTFRETQEFAGFLRNGILLSEPLPATPNLEIGQAAEVTQPVVATRVGTEVRSDEKLSGELLVPSGKRSQRYTIPLDKSGGLATVELPVPVRERDLTKVGAWLTYMATVIGDEPNELDAPEAPKLTT
jgi:hypothetical protein